MPRQKLPNLTPFSFPLLGSTARLEKLYLKRRLTWAIRAIISLVPGSCTIPVLWLSEADILGLATNYEATKQYLTAQFTEMATRTYHKWMQQITEEMNCSEGER